MTDVPWLAMALLGLLGCAIGIWLDGRRPGLDWGWADRDDEDEWSAR